jgi:iron-sulfur cluster assembly protein
MASTNADVRITDLALERAKGLRATEGNPDDWGIRLAVDGGGCSGFMYDISFCPPGGQEGDRVAQFDGLDLYIDRKSYLFLIGIELGWEETFMKTGFVFKNPNVTAACGCGESVAF